MIYSIGDPKYAIDVTHVQKPGAEPGVTEPCARLVNKASGKPIPHDEPVFILRAQDRTANIAIHQYQNAAFPTEQSDEHFSAVGRRLGDFIDFAINHPDRMKWPD